MMEYIIFVVGVVVTLMVCGGLFIASVKETGVQYSSKHKQIRPDKNSA